MSRIDSAALAHHLEDALTVTPFAVLTGFQERDATIRRAATAKLAPHLANRLDCFDIEFAEWQPPVGDQLSLFAD